MTSAPTRRWLRITLAATLVILVVALAYRAALVFLWNTWTTDAYYTHGIPVAFAAALLAAWRWWRGDASDAPSYAPFVLAIPVFVYVAGLRLVSAHLVLWSLPALLLAVAFAAGGAARARAMLAPVALFALTLPTPWTLPFGLAMQQASAFAAGAILALVGIGFSVDITTLHAGDLVFEVTPACSGFQSAVSLLALAALVAALVPMSRARRATMLVAAVPLALVLNVARILAIVGIGLRWGTDAAEGFFHNASGLLLFLGEVLVLSAIAGLVRAPGRRSVG